jgi:hypothetical protein
MTRRHSNRTQGRVELSVSLDAVRLDDPLLDTLNTAHAAIPYGPGPVNFMLNGEDLVATGRPGKRTLAPCSAA